MPNSPQTNLSPLHLGNEIARFVTNDLLREQPVVVDHYLDSTPDAPATEAKRKRLMDEKVPLPGIINEHMMSTRKAIPSNSDVGSVHSENDDGPESPPSLNNTPHPTVFNPRFLTDSQFSVSGFSTPDIFTNQTSQPDEYPFASVHEEPWLSQDDRLAQELA